jgi:hypothetical protein
MRKLNKDELIAVVSLAGKMKKEIPYYRKGQSFFIALSILHPDIADSIRATQFDPFYQDEKIEECIAEICY